MVPALLPPPAPFKLFVLLAGVAEVRPVQVRARRSASPAARGISASGSSPSATAIARWSSCATRGREVAIWIAAFIVTAAVSVWLWQRYNSKPVTPDISIVIPLRDEEPNVVPLHEELTAVLDAHRLSYELILVDDGSKDGTFGRLVETAGTRPATCG